jgi:hypothetical protein
MTIASSANSVRTGRKARALFYGKYDGSAV